MSPDEGRYGVMQQPFVLLDGASGAMPGLTYLYRRPREIVTAMTPQEVLPALARVDRQKGEWAGYLTYEAGLALEPRLGALPSRPDGRPLLWFARFDQCDTLSDDETRAWLASASPSGAHARLGPMVPDIAYDAYAKAFGRIADAIVAGDIYQANLTFPLSARWQGCPLALYAAIRPAARAGHGAILFDGGRWTLSFSPELFFHKQGDRITVRPMKGTAGRGRTPEQDRAQINALLNSGKDRAENLMIVDLLRNDLSRIAQAGTVQVEKLFAVETYPTVHQMTSTIHADIAAAAGMKDVMLALFPCGSITGAPKIRAMELIHAVEARRRGVYCGSIGRITPEGDAAFNVAIRTVQLDPVSGLATMGVGSGVVADSRLEDEWRECLLKAQFLTHALASA